MKSKFFIFFLYLSNAFANPQGADVINGDVLITSADNSLLVNQLSDKAIINWQNFSIAKDEITKIVQPSNTSAILNRVVTDNPSLIYGNLEANGKVYLINQNGIFIGKDGQISAMSFIASTLNVLDNEFLDGKDINFKGDSTYKIENLGKIRTAKEIYLIAKDVINTGSLNAENVAIAGSTDVLLYEKGNENFIVRKNTTGSIENNGTINAVQVDLKAAGDNVYALAINQNGIINATGIENRNGRIILSADSGKIEVNGNLKAVSVDKGGEINLLSEYVKVKENSVIDVSSENDGGTILIGGDYQGKNENIQNAKYVYVERGSTIDASSKSIGNGGKVILWSDESTGFFGSIEAKGGKISGDGGFVEISSKGFLDPQGLISTIAYNGKTGSLLLDPTDVTISAGADVDNSFSAPNYSFSALVSNINVTNLENNLANSNVIINTASGYGGNGNITIESNISWSTANTLTLIADRSIIINNGVSITSTGTGDFTAMDFTASGTGSEAGIDFTFDVLVQSVDGDINLKGTGGDGVINSFGVSIQDSTVTTTQGSITIEGNSGILTGEGTGVYIENSSVISTSSTKADEDISISITGTSNDGDDNSFLSHGVFIRDQNSQHEILSNSGKIVINGTGNNKTNSGAGIAIFDNNIKAENSASIELTGNGLGSENPGIVIDSLDNFYNEFYVVDGDITISATGGSNGYGFQLIGNAAGEEFAVAAKGSGNISINAAGDNNFGLELSNHSMITAVSGNITINATGLDNSLPGINSEVNTTIGGASSTGDILLKANFIKLAGAVSGTGTLTFEPINNNDPIDLLDSSSTNFRLLSSDLDSINSGFSNVFIGNSSGSHTIVIGTGVESYSFNNFPITIRGDNIDLNADLTSGDSGANDITFKIGQTSGGNFNLYKNVTLTTGDLLILGGSFDDQFNVITTIPQKGTINGLGGSDTLQGPDVNTIWNITENNQGNISGSLSFINAENLIGGAQSDRFVLSNNKGLTGFIDGGNSPTPINTLDYSDYTSEVFVDLQNNTATNVLGGVFNIQHVIFPVKILDNVLVALHFTDLILEYNLKRFADFNIYRLYFKRDLSQVIYKDDKFFNAEGRGNVYPF